MLLTSPSTITITITITIIITIITFLYTTRRRVLQPTTKVGNDFTASTCYGPKTYPIIGCLIPFYQNRHRLLDWYTELVAASPTQTIAVRRLGARRTVVTANPANVEHVLKSNFANYPKGRPFTDILGDLLGRGIFNADGALWHAQRKLASHEFSVRSLRRFVAGELAAETRHRLLPALAAAARDRHAVDIQDLLRRFAFDTVCQVALGWDPHYLDPSSPTPPESDLADAFEAASAISARRGSAPVAFVWKVKRALRIGSERRLRRAVALIRSSISDLIQRRRDEIKKNNKGNIEKYKDLLSRLILEGHDDDTVRDMAVSFVVAGRDTTPAALTWLFYLLSGHARAESEVAREVGQRHGALEYEALKELKVLEASIYEAMRLYPPVVWDSKHAERADVLPDGTKIEAGDRVTYFPYGMGRMESLWGDRWHEFEPRRWLTTTSESGCCSSSSSSSSNSDGGGVDGDQVAVVRVSAYRYPVFQAGPRVCMGKEMAIAQMKYVTAAVLGRFELRRAAEAEEEGARGRPAVVVPRLTAHMEGGLRMMVVERGRR
ncbi:Cytochrome P450 94B3 [Ananas comosus]|uniref:Cytochrome P450 94B3 n=1 Tax=Ananas comosus TaxID=4615 RepID=A0A199W4U1_ANACO|nr:Cytochrome P450 94B3 [Ananas comosus]